MTIENTEKKQRDTKIPGPDHPITIIAANGLVRVTVAGTTLAESHRALVLEEKGYAPAFYIPRENADMSLLVRTTHYSYCPYKGDTTYYSIPVGGSKSEYAVWSYEKPYASVSAIKNYLAFYPSRVDSIEYTPNDAVRVLEAVRSRIVGQTCSLCSGFGSPALVLRVYRSVFPVGRDSQPPVLHLGAAETWPDHRSILLQMALCIATADKRKGR
jgi:uncharacterized protein (DUF427 family)